MKTATLISKEEVMGMKFSDTEVLDTPDAIHARKADLEKAMVLGNGYHAKAGIIFETESGPKKIETHVWATSDKFVTLKGGILIPTHCIRKVIC